MFTDSFLKCIPIIILQNEGGNKITNDPDDPGGLTKYGISKAAFPNEDIANLTQERAEQIYYEKYWLPLSLDSVNDKLAGLQIFDFAVNAGIFRSAVTAQKIVNVMQDGDIGPKTLKAINSYNNFAQVFMNARKDYYNSLVIKNPVYKKYIKGWLNRVDNTKF